MNEEAHNSGQFRVGLLAPRSAVLGQEPCGGSEVVLREDRVILEGAGAQLTVYGQAAVDGAKVERIPVRSQLPLVASLEYCRPFVRRESHSLLLAYNEPTVAALAPDRSIIRFDWTTALPRYWKLPYWLKRFQRSLYLFPSESERKIFLDSHSQIPSGRTVVIPNAVDTKLFAPQNRSIPVPRVGYAGQWGAFKGVEVLLEAWKTVCREIPDAELWLAGGPRLWKAGEQTPGASQVSESVQSLDNKNVKVVGSLPRHEMPGFWNSVNVAVVPSLREAFGLVALEALSCGVPVVASRAGGLPEIVAEEECGLLMPPGNSQELAQALLKLLAGESLRSRFSQAARERAMAFSIERRTKIFLRLMEERSRECGSNAPNLFPKDSPVSSGSPLISRRVE